ncbi:YciI family protein [Nocardioides psychrotolerans]|uniref:YciI family protein n=1 Tax=Nocardioides psychrotolerans TaxID=1005945 RepID=UPI003138278F
MTQYLIYFNQQWVGDHPEEWFRSRGPLARAVVEEIREAGDYVFAGGLEEDGPVFSADATSGELLFTDGPFVETKEWLGGLTIVDVADEEAARAWAGRIAEACGWPQEVRMFGG